MKKFLLTLDFQKSFIHALENDSMKNWYQNNEETLAKISECLETIEVPKTDKKEEEISKLIKNSFLLLFRSFWDPSVFQLKKRSKLKTLGRRLNPKQNIRKIEIEEFKRKFMKSVESKKWSNFYSSYSSYFDNVIRLARNQEKLDIVVETENKNQYNTLTDATAHTHQVNLAKEENMKDQKKKKSKLASHLLESPKIERNVPVKRSSSEASSASLSFSAKINERNEELQRELNAQNEKFAEELRKMQEKRERLNREAEEDMRQFRKESAMRIQMFLNCIQLRIRWEEQEQEWGDWLKSLRTPVARVKTVLLEFEYQRKHNDEEENKSDIMYLQKSIQIAYDKLTYEFENLVNLSYRYEDKLFLKVIQYFISHLATKLCVTMEELDEYEPNEEFFNKINEMSKNIDAIDIPTTSKLRLICSNASPDDYEHIDPPKVPNYACVITE
ncbi:hypothetical protein L5515_008821 [Caenorhabditis briggsae]|uniref:Uncharacterized protein n=1 Tax=Caenorhabditis briggsae TaxID=6238 RepID=A0AAE9JMY1_CAEBR|nr:hypothetical protein L5515_008821 [Caenorhabditis briggsae]